MSNFKEIREEKDLSQRALAAKAGIAYKSIQLLESGSDVRLSTVEKIAQAYGFPKEWTREAVQSALAEPLESVHAISIFLVKNPQADWHNLVFNLVDAFRKKPDPGFVQTSLDVQTPQAFRCLLASLVETLCDEKGLNSPAWCGGEGALEHPWFVSGMENLKAMALLESPVHFRKRNIFVLGNFLDRA